MHEVPNVGSLKNWHIGNFRWIIKKLDIEGVLFETRIKIKNQKIFQIPSSKIDNLKKDTLSWNFHYFILRAYDSYLF